MNNRFSQFLNSPFFVKKSRTNLDKNQKLCICSQKVQNQQLPLTLAIARNGTKLLLKNTPSICLFTSIFSITSIPYRNLDVAIANPNSTPQVEAVVSHLVGVMDRSIQVAANPEAVNVRMTTCEVQVSGSETVYLYQEQAIADNLSHPYRQRFLQILPNQDKVESRAYKPIDAAKWIGLCDRPPTQRTLDPSDLSNEAVCSVFLMPIANIYLGATQPGGCPANIRGAVTITNTIVLHNEGMDTWDRGFDAAGNQVWGAENEAYQFRWVD
ncbi:MAG: chromophore lyase CpcT/CpeT [Oscillatoria sp. PMC 1068.18]|nr:chromophore lyase CpcT/CpeT [Oscillatoria sp. PMC 1076.18]MEC4990531.1 chromophore lyase CpcT/CpeT [Oscillatoria sp. PMC 1068.18]